MLPRFHRLTKKSDFDDAYRSKWAVSGHFFLIKIKTNELGCVRIGIVISKKIIKKATGRNKIKRQLRQIVRQETMQTKKGIDIVIACKSAIQKASYIELQKEWQSIWSKINL